GTFLQNADAQLAALRARKLLQPDRSRQSGRAAADDHDIEFHAFALVIAHATFRRMVKSEAIPYHFAMAQSNPAETLSNFAALRWLLEAGADEAIGEMPLNRFRLSAIGPAVTQPERASARRPIMQPISAPPPRPAQQGDQ